MSVKHFLLADFSFICSLPFLILSAKKMVKPLNEFLVCQVVTLRKLNFSWSEIQKQLELKHRSTAQMAYKRYIKNKSYLAAKPTGRLTKTSKKTEKKLIRDVLKNPKTSLERIRVDYNSFSANNSFSRSTVRRILKKNGVCSRMAAKKLC